jgi:hypothetical protein
MDVSGARTALERGRPVVLVTPPAVERAGAVWDLAAAPLLVITADAEAAAAWAAATPADRRTHAVTGIGRSTRLLKQGAVDVVAGAPRDLAALVARSALKLNGFTTIVIAWPEALVAGDSDATLEALLGELPDARRLILSWNPSALADFCERHARRPEIVGPLGLGQDGVPLGTVAPARFAVVSTGRRAAATHDWLDVLDPKRPYVWSEGPPAPPQPSCDAVLCTRLPTRDEFRALASLGPVTLLLDAAQLPYARSLAAPLTALRLAGAADRAEDRGEALRAQVIQLLERGDVDAELALLDPLFQQYDPAEVAAALLALQRAPVGATAAPETTAPVAAGWVRIFVNVGKKDQAGAKDLVGALIREVGLDKSAIGKIEVRESFSVVEVSAGAVDRVVHGLTGVTIRGRRAQARRDRAGER